MKFRKGFVSNSSSSSFIILNDVSIIPVGIDYAKLNKKQKMRLFEQGFVFNIKDDVYLTQFIGDDERFYEATHTTEYVVEDGFKHLKLKDNVKEYCDGGHGCPYDEEGYDEISENVWLMKGDTNENS
jgi:hypothetical protein